ncbi:MAG: trigger factor, partial [Marmoricola sp.]|nr:trigger factor [Marmoricola sp.]
AQQSGQNPDEFVKHMVEHNHIPEMVSEVVRGKALARIVEGATVTDASGNVVDLKNLLPDGSIGDPAAEEAVEDTAPQAGQDAAAEPSASEGSTEADGSPEGVQKD